MKASAESTVTMFVHHDDSTTSPSEVTINGSTTHRTEVIDDISMRSSKEIENINNVIDIDETRANMNHSSFVNTVNSSPVNLVNETLKEKLTEGGIKEDITSEKKKYKRASICDIRNRINQAFDGSKYTSPLNGDFPVFERSEICRGKCLGRGGFSDVYEIPNIRCTGESMRSLCKDESIRSLRNTSQNEVRQDSLSSLKSSSNKTTRRSFLVRNSNRSSTTSTSTPSKVNKENVSTHLSDFLRNPEYYYEDDSDDPDNNNVESRLFITKHCIRHNGDVRYAIKQLRSDHDDNSEQYYIGISDLIVETRILYNLQHPNIIKLRAISNTDPYERGYFLILDRLYDTLQTRIQIWNDENKKYKSIIRRYFTTDKRREQYVSRLTAAYDLSAAVTYLHEKGICHRDIKPDNIGFDVRGDIKLFDFGMARDLSVLKDDGEGMFRLTQMCGSLRYMAPEVALGKRYNQGCDVYSFTVLLYEMLALKRPYKGYRRQEEFFLGVYVENKRPVIPKKLQASWRELLNGGWNKDPKLRLDMITIKYILHNKVDEVGNIRKSFSRRRSTFVYNPKQNNKKVQY